MAEGDINAAPDYQALAAQVQALQQQVAAANQGDENNDLGAQLRRLLKGSASTGGGKIGLAAADAAVPAVEGVPNVVLFDGDVPVSPDILRLVQRENLIPPVSLFDPVVSLYAAGHHRDLLPPGSDNKALNEARKDIKTYYKLDHLMDEHKFLPAVLKLVETVATVLCADNDTKDYVRDDGAAFVLSLVARASGDGVWEVVREYALTKIDVWRAGIIAKTPFNLNRIGPFDQGAWNGALAASAAPHNADLVKRPELDGDSATAWGAAVKLAGVGDSSKLDAVVQERRERSRLVLTGAASSGAIPPSLNFTPTLGPGGPQRASRVGGGRSGPYGAGSGATGGTAARAPAGQHHPTNGVQGNGASTGGGAFVCICCKGSHSYKECANISPTLQLVGRELRHSYDDGDKGFICRNFNMGRCAANETTCTNSHGCSRCGSKGHPATSCSFRGA
ncbi:hypothetical protein Rhopal_007613-T1 [Rhodotorula paludigena]|uniref:CCHC-type domain-containing protein n=1 Tax=Rhodotorula paludigena TaxID=86838 RepID=A0AAV5GYJ3_9BASI|nr:hypothetical protein Rhopal_007613-T1 [Rhodotorula paludigena]